MKFSWAKLAVALVTICNGSAGPYQAGAQSTAPGPWTAPAQAVGKPNPVVASEGSIAEGKALYQQECLICHGSAGTGDGRKAGTLKVSPADLSNPNMRDQSDGALFWKINEGRTPMPAFHPKLSTPEVWALLNYIRTLAPRTTAATPVATEPQASKAAPEPAKRRDQADPAAAESGETNSSREPQSVKTGEVPAKADPAPPKTPVAAETADRGAGLLPPDYFHVLINPLPIYGLAIAVLALLGGLVMRNRPAQVLALGLVVLSAASAWPVSILGEKAYNRVYLVADNDGQQALDLHKHRAEKLVYVFYALAVVALSAALVPAKVPKAAFPLALITLITALASLAAGGWIAKAGGKIRHPEFRNEPAPQSSPGPAPGGHVSDGQASGGDTPVAAKESSNAGGKSLYEQECVICHGATGKGDGPKADTLKVSPADLSNPRMRQKSDGALSLTITEGKPPMPSFHSKLSAPEVAALVNYIRTLEPKDADGGSPATKPQAGQTALEPGKNQAGGDHPEAARGGANSRQKHQGWTAPAAVDGMKSQVTANESSIAEGSGLYQQECMICHGPAGEGDGRKALTLDVSPADLSNPGMRAQTDGAVFWKISEGRTPMPSFRLRFSRHEVWALVNYVRTLTPREAAAESGGNNSSQKPQNIDAGKTPIPKEKP